MNERDEFFDLIDAYVLGTLEASERENVRRHLDVCATCRREYDELRNVIDVLPQGLAAERPSAASHERLLARLDAGVPDVPVAPVAPTVAPPVASEPTPIESRRVSTVNAVPGARTYAPWTAALAAGLVLALAGDGFLAWQAYHRDATAVAFVRSTPSPIVTAAPRTAMPRRVVALPALPRPIASPRAQASVSPSASPTSAIAEAALRSRIAQLERELHAERHDVAVRTENASRDTARIAFLTGQLSRVRAEVVAQRRATPAPIAIASPAPPNTLVAALSNGRVYGVDGVVGAEPWHLTIVQPPAAANAIIYSDVPHAPNGQTYRTWVVRAGKTFDAGELRPGNRDVLDMPMPLQDGDVVAFSREAVGSGSTPTNPFLMQITIR
jgi:anti-sigma factor RsiW